MTDADLLQTLVAELRPVAPARGRRELASGLGAGAALALAALVLHFGVQPGLDGPALGPFVVKAAYTGALALLAFAGLATLARPGGGAPRAAALLLPILGLVALAAWTLASATPRDVGPLLWGASWDRCPLRILALSLPVFAGVVLGLRRRAPTRLRAAGAAAGLLSGATAATVYALACTEPSPVFVLVWYTAGVAASTALGAAAGPRLLRW